MATVAISTMVNELGSEAVAPCLEETRLGAGLGEQVEIGKALEGELVQRVEVNQHTKGKENFPDPPQDQTRDLATNAVGCGSFSSESSPTKGKVGSGLRPFELSRLIQGGKFVQDHMRFCIEFCASLSDGIFFIKRNVRSIGAVRSLPKAPIVLTAGVQQLQLGLDVVQLKPKLRFSHFVQHFRVLVGCIRLKGPLHALDQLGVVAAAILLRRFMDGSMQLWRKPERRLHEILLIDAGSHASIIVPAAMSAIAPIMEACLYHCSMPPSRKRK